MMLLRCRALSIVPQSPVYHEDDTFSQPDIFRYPSMQITGCDEDCFSPQHVRFSVTFVGGSFNFPFFFQLSHSPWLAVKGLKG